MVLFQRRNQELLYFFTLKIHHHPSEHYASGFQPFSTKTHQLFIWKQNTFRDRERLFNLQKHSDHFVFVEIMKKELYFSIDK